MFIVTPTDDSSQKSPPELTRAIRDCYEGKGIGQVQLAELSGIPQQTISRLARGETAPRLPQLAAIESACGRPRGWIVVQAGFGPDVQSVADAVAMDPDLDDDGREAVLLAYEAAVEFRRTSRKE